MSTMARLENVVNILRADFGIDEPDALIRAVRIYPARVEFEFFALDESGQKHCDPETGWVQTETRTFEATA